MQYLDAQAVRLALRNGVQSVIAKQENLNSINVFPVADGDTGTNLALTVAAMGASLAHSKDLPLHRLIARAADALLDGARGNSGAILAQFFQGVSDSTGELSRYTVHTFSKAMHSGSTYARDALSEPREGTILSVIDAFADALVRLVSKDNTITFEQLLGGGFESAQTALSATTNQLAELKKAGVVDAGGKGFVALLEGMLRYVRDGEIVEAIDIPQDILDNVMAGEDVDLEYRYCTECIISGEHIDRRKLREGLTALGGSLVLAGSNRKAKVHIHVNDPDAVFSLARQHGELSSEKADDMQLQQHTTHAAKKGVAIITDSAADLTDEDIEALDIHVVPLRLQFGKQGYLDKLSITQPAFFEELARNPIHPTTSQPAPGDYRRQYQFLASHFADVIAISLTGAASGTFTASQSAAKRVDASGKIQIVNSLNASIGQGLIVRHAARMAKDGASAEAIIDAVHDLIPNTQTFALVQDLTYAVRGGRVPPSRKWLAKLLNINPVLRTQPDGQISSNGIIFGRKGRVEKLARYISKRLDHERALQIGIGHANCAQEAEALRQALLARMPNITESYCTHLCSSVGVHGGPGTLVAGFMYV